MIVADQLEADAELLSAPSSLLQHLEPWLLLQCYSEIIRAFIGRFCISLQAFSHRDLTKELEADVGIV